MEFVFSDLAIRLNPINQSCSALLWASLIKENSPSLLASGWPEAKYGSDDNLAANVDLAREFVVALLNTPSRKILEQEFFQASRSDVADFLSEAHALADDCVQFAQPDPQSPLGLALARGELQN